MYRALAFIVGLFHLWVMITFAAIMVPCLTRAESKPFLRRLVRGLCDCSDREVARWNGTPRSLSRSFISGRLYPIPNPALALNAMSALHVLLFIGGSLCAAYFIA